MGTIARFKPVERRKKRRLSPSNHSANKMSLNTSRSCDVSLKHRELSKKSFTCLGYMGFDLKETDLALVTQRHITEETPKIGIVELSCNYFVIRMGLKHLDTAQYCCAISPN